LRGDLVALFKGKIDVSAASSADDICDEGEGEWYGRAKINRK